MRGCGILAVVIVLACPQIFPQTSHNCILVGTTGGTCTAVASQGSLAVIGAGGYVVVLDCTDPSRPVQLGSCRTPGLVNSIFLEGNLAYVAAGSAGFRIFDLSDPTAPRQLSASNTNGEAQDVAVNNGIAYVTAELAGLRVFDVRDPVAPKPVGVYDPPDEFFADDNGFFADFQIMGAFVVRV